MHKYAYIYIYFMYMYVYVYIYLHIYRRTNICTHTLVKANPKKTNRLFALSRI